MKYEEIIMAINSGLTDKIKSETPGYMYYRQALTEYETIGPSNFNVLVQDAAKKLKTKLQNLMG